MHRSTLLVLGVVLVVVGLGGLVVATAFQGSLAGGTGCPPGTPCSAEGSAGLGGMDAMFIQQMIPHHDGAIAMSELALTRAEHPELKRLARSIKRTQTAENAQMRRWYLDWYGSEVSSGSAADFGMMGGMMGSRMTDLEALKRSDSFDKAFLEQMIPHHQMAIMMSRMAGGATQRPEMRDFTQSIIDTQAREIAQMQTWYEEWYGN